MIPCRGLRLSGQGLGFARRRIETLSSRQFSSNSGYQIRAGRTTPLLSNSKTLLNGVKRPGFLAIAALSQAGVGVRFASTQPAAVTAPSPTEADLVSSLDSTLDIDHAFISNIPEHIGYLKSLGLDYGWGPTATVEWCLEHVHILAGTPWWVSIAITTLAFRAILFKPFMMAADNGARIASIQHITKPLTEKMNKSRRAGDTAGMLAVKQEMTILNGRAGVKYWKSLAGPVTQMFVGYGTFVLLRAMAKLPVPGLETGGLLWFHNLTYPDPFFALPVATAGCLHWLLRTGGESGVQTISPAAQKLLMWGFPGLSLLFTWWMPAALQLSFLLGTLVGFFQAMLFRSPAFRRMAGMYPLPSRILNPSKVVGPVSSYKGNMNILPPHIQGPPSMTYEAPTTTTGAASSLSPINDLKKTYTSMKSNLSEVTGTARERMAERTKKAEQAEKDSYEAKRGQEEKRLRWEQEDAKRADRALRAANQAASQASLSAKRKPTKPGKNRSRNS